MVEAVREMAKKHLKEVELLLGWTEGPDALHVTPLVLCSEKEVDRLTWNPFCSINLAGYLYELKGRRTGIFAKGCDSRSIVQLINEGLIKREEVVVFGLPCKGCVDVKKLSKELKGEEVAAVSFDGDEVVVQTKNKKLTLPFKDLVFDKCIGCPYPTPLLYDYLVGKPLPPQGTHEGLNERTKRIEALPPEERLEFWKSELERCIRCYACRNSCPLCVCKDFCSAESREPLWISHAHGIKEKWLWQVFHVLHVAGRCTGCGECERACPVGIPLLTIRHMANNVIKDLFDYEAGIKLGEKPPLLTYSVLEPKIEEEKW